MFFAQHSWLWHLAAQLASAQLASAQLATMKSSTCAEEKHMRKANTYLDVSLILVSF